MDKPITLKQRDFKDAIVKVINESGLPAFIIAPILQQALAEIERIEEQQYQADLKAYEEGENNGKITEA